MQKILFRHAEITFLGRKILFRLWEMLFGLCPLNPVLEFAGWKLEF
jgi:hypothetical protein